MSSKKIIRAKKIEDLFQRISINILQVRLLNSLYLNDDIVYGIEVWFRRVKKYIGKKRSLEDAEDMRDHLIFQKVCCKREPNSEEKFIIKCFYNIVFHLDKYIRIVRGN
jgi:hypothetical protein